MRKLISIFLLALIVAGSAAGAWFCREPLGHWASSRLMIEENNWVEKPASQLRVSLVSDEPLGMQSVSKQIASLLAPFDGQLKQSWQDSPVFQSEILATIPPQAVLPLHDLTQKIVDRHNESIRSAAKYSPGKKSIRKSGRKPRRIARGRPTATKSKPSPVSSKAVREIQRKKQDLMRTWAESEKSHDQAADSRKQFRHPEAILKNDPEAQELKQKLVDLEMTLAEVIDHYTPAHPRVRDLQNEIAAVRSSLDRRVMVGEQDLDARWERQKSEFLRKKAALEREEKRLIAASTVRTPDESVETTSPDESVESEEPEQPAAGQTKIGAMIQLAWNETSASTRELVIEKRLSPENIAIGSAILAGAAALTGFFLGFIGGFGGGPGTASSEVVDAESSDARAELLKRVSEASASATAKPRKPLPPLTSAPPAAAPEKIIDESDLPGEPWISVPHLPEVEKGLYTVFAPTSPAADLYMKNAKHLTDLLPKSDKTQVVTIAAVKSGAGTSTFVGNLAVALTAHRPVLMIDFHHTAPNLHSLFSVKTSSQDLMSSGPLAPSVLPTPIDKLFLLPLFSPRTEKEMLDRNLKKSLAAFVKEANPPPRLILIDAAPIGRSDLFEQVLEFTDVFLLLLGPEPTPASAKSNLKRLLKTMKKKPILRVTRQTQEMANALTARPGTKYEFLETSV